MMIFLFELINISFEYINSKLNIPLNVIQRVNTSLRMSTEIPHSQLSYLKVIDLDQYSFMPWLTHSSKRQISKL